MMFDDQTASPPPIPALTWKIAAVTGAGAFMALLDSTLANLAVESIRVDLGSTLPIVQWVATGYLAALTVSLPATGWLGSRYGTGRVWAWALAAFVVASALCALAPGPWTLIGARIGQGLAAGVMVPAGQAVLGSAAGPAQLGRLMGALGLVVALGPAVGPAVGGLLLEVASWRWLFWINIPFGVAALVAARGLVPTGSTNPNRTLDRTGLALLGVGLPLLLFGATQTGATGATRFTVVAMIVGATLATSFIATALRASNPLIDLRLLRDPTFAAATTINGLTGASLYGGLLLLPLYLQIPTGHTVATTGLLLLAMGLGSAVALYVGGTLTDRCGPGPVTLAGSVVLAITTVAFLVPAALSTAVIAAALVGRGIGIAWAQMPAMTAAYESITDEQMSDATTLVNIVQRVGGATGATGLVIVLAQTGGPTNSGAYTWAFAALTAIAMLTLIPAAMLPHHGQRQPADPTVEPDPASRPTGTRQHRLRITLAVRGRRSHHRPVPGGQPARGPDRRQTTRSADPRRARSP